MGITSFGWSRPAIASNRAAAHGYSNYSNSRSSSKRFCGSDVNRNNTILGLQGQLVGRGGEGYNLSSCSQIMSGVVDVGNDNLSIGSCLVQKPGNRSSNIIYGGDLDHERLHRGFVMTGGGLPERRGDDHSRSKSLYAGAGSGVNYGRVSSVVGVHHDRRRQPAGVPKFGSIGVATGKKMAIASARINEKLAHLSADLQHNLFCVMHPRVLRLVEHCDQVCRYREEKTGGGKGQRSCKKEAGTGTAATSLAIAATGSPLLTSNQSTDIRFS